MPLPTADMQWPPTDPAVQEALADWDAWYSSDPDLLTERYRLRGVRGPQNRPSQLRGGVVGRFARWWWGQPTPQGEKRSKIHVPLPADIARTSADLLFSEPPKLTADDSGVQGRLEELVDDGFHSSLLEGGEVAAALGGSYLRIVWDTEVAERPWINSVHADAAIPEFRYGRLLAVTFWTIVKVDEETVWRHLERHEKGVILHGLYQGSLDRLGTQVPMNSLTETQPIAAAVPDGVVETGAPNYLTAAYIPNARPARSWRHTPGAAGWGQSDYQGVEQMFDALDETYSSWMRDIRNGAGRIIVPESMLESNGPGKGARFDADRQIWSPLNVLQRANGEMNLEVVQFAIRVQEHSQTCAELTETTIRQAGYSAATFGSIAEGQAVTATEIRARERRSMATRARKALAWRPAIADIVEALLAIEAGPLFRSGVDVERPDVEFQDSISEDPQTLATTATLLRQAEAASTQIIVEMIHPDWDEDRVQEEVDRIQGESGRSVADPVQLGAEYPPSGDDSGTEDIVPPTPQWTPGMPAPIGPPVPPNVPM
jgi:A118 family predicted phage portal protein